MKVKVIVYPNSKKPRAERDALGSLRIYVKSPPLEGRANAEAADILADYFKVKRYNVTLKTGGKAKQKIFEIITG